MEYYETYMARQEVSPDLHARLLALEAPKQKKKGGIYMKFGALAACAALIFGLGSGWWHTSPPAATSPVAVSDGSGPEDILAVEPTLAPDESTTDPAATPKDGFLIHSPAAGDRLNFYSIPALNFQEGMNEVAASIALPDGSFFVELTLADLQKIFWGSQGKPADLGPDTDLPWVLGWDGYTVRAGATYDGTGGLWMLTVYGSKGLDTFELQVSPGRLPPQCLVDPDGESVDVNGVGVTSYYHVYDRNGDGLTDYVCTSEFMVDGYGYRFRSAHSDAGEGEERAAERAKFFHACFVMRAAQWTDSRCYFDHIAHNDNIPVWEEASFDTLAQARERADFAPYLPQTAPVNWSEFYGRLSYQKENYNYLFVRWSKGYDNVEIDVHLPEGDSADYYHDQLVDVSVPESYDWRLYDGPISDTVPEEYRMAFYKPAFRAEDMSLEVVKARMNDHDTGGEICHFYVLHDNGTVVGYDCSGISAQQVWALVEATLG